MFEPSQKVRVSEKIIPYSGRDYNGLYIEPIMTEKYLGKVYTIRKRYVVYDMLGAPYNTYTFKEDINNYQFPESFLVKVADDEKVEFFVLKLKSGYIYYCQSCDIESIMKVEDYRAISALDRDKLVSM